MNVKRLLLLLPDVVTPPEGTPDAVVQYETAEPVYHVLKGGELQAHEGQATAPDVTIRVKDENLLKLLEGELNPMTAMMTGRLRVKGDVMLAQRLLGMIRRDQVEELRAAVEQERT